MAARKKKPTTARIKSGLNADAANRRILIARLANLAREKGYMPVSRKLRVTNTTLLAVLVGGLARKSSEELVLKRFAKFIKRRAA